jgi:hypothetical protein
MENREEIRGCTQMTQMKRGISHMEQLLANPQKSVLSASAVVHRHLHVHTAYESLTKLTKMRPLLTEY